MALTQLQKNINYCPKSKNPRLRILHIGGSITPVKQRFFSAENGVPV